MIKQNIVKNMNLIRSFEMKDPDHILLQKSLHLIPDSVKGNYAGEHMPVWHVNVGKNLFV